MTGMPIAHRPHQGQPVVTAGCPLPQARAAMVLIHGRGATAHSILELGRALPHPDMAYLAPQAHGQSWYPYSFLAPLAQNEPGLTSALETIAELVAQIEDAGIPGERIVLAGFSQGACLACEFVARQARRYGALLAFSGGLIGPPGMPRTYAGTLAGTPVFLGSSDPDPHVPAVRVQETATVLQGLGASVTLRLYPAMGHTIIQDEIDLAQSIVAQIR